MKVPDGWVVYVKKAPEPWQTRWEYMFQKENEELPVWFSGKFFDTRDEAIETAIRQIEKEIAPKPSPAQWERV